MGNMTGNIILLHLSDLHFGDKNETNCAKRTNTLNKLLLTLKKLPTEWKPQSIAISGDIGWHGLENDYKIAEAWLMELLKTLDLSADDIIPAPGNHDINLEKAADTPVPSDHINADELLDLDLLENVSIPFKGFEDFCKRMKIPPLTLGSKSSYLAGSRVHNGITWLVLNSAWFCREGRTEKLHIGLPHLEVITAAKSWEERDIPTIGVLHHPPQNLHEEELTSYGSRRNTYDFLAGECGIILSGHVHGRLTQPDRKYDKTLLFTGGSSYSGEKVWNNFSLFRLDTGAGTVERLAFQWEPAEGEWQAVEKYSQVFSLRGAETGKTTLHRRLFEGSKQYYKDLRGENGRFYHLDISDILLPGAKNKWLDSLVALKKETEGMERANLLELMPLLWKDQRKHAVISGEGGMGKTVSLLRLWEEFTGEYDACQPVAVFIQLNEINEMPERERKDFILSAIKENYFPDGVDLEELRGFLKTPLPGDVPAVILLLDGFNEVTGDNRELLIQLKRSMEGWRGVQLVITSRFDMRESYGWEHVLLLDLLELDEERVREYLESQKVTGGNGRLGHLLRNPMMLTLYASTCEVQEKWKRGNFKEKVETPGELLWNFMEAQMAVLLERLGMDENKWWFYKFLLTFMLPAVGYEMETAGLFALEREQVYKAIETYCVRFAGDDFFEAFPEYEEYEEALPLGECENGRARRQRRFEIVEILCRGLRMLVKEGESFRFLHQHFRDYFAALHILQEAEMGVKRGEVADVLKQRALPVYIRRFMGEMAGEHYQKPVFQAGKGWLKKEDGSSLLNRVLDLCRGVFDGSVGFGPWNIVEVWKEVRGELSGAELSELDLSRVVLNGTHCCRFFKNDYLAANFDGSLLHEVNIFPQGHYENVSSTMYSGDGEKILSASYDCTIKEWDVESGQCLMTFTGHTDWVNSALYSGDGEKILSASEDNTIKEWDVASGKCLKTFTGHTDRVNSALYSGNGKKILSASEDNTIKEWDVASGKCLKTFIGHHKSVYSAVYSGDGGKILSTSEDNIIKEWDVESGQCLKTFKGDDDSLTSAIYSGDGKKMLSVSDDQTIKEWDVESGQCLKTFTGHESEVNSAHYSFDGKKMLSASNDGTIKEWDVESGQCLKTFSVNADSVTSASVLYSGDGKKILAVSTDKSIKEWDVETGQCLKTFIGHESEINSAHYSFDGGKILSDSYDGTIKEWDVESGQCLNTFAGHTDSVIRALHSFDGEKILSFSFDGTIKEWDVESGQCLKTFTGHEDAVFSAFYSGDGKKILSASGDHTIKEWDVESGQCLKTFTGHEHTVTSALYSVDGKKILSASSDHTIKEWDVESGQCLKTFTGHKNVVLFAHYSVDGRKILSDSGDHTIKEWDVESGQCLKTYKKEDLNTEENPGSAGEKLEFDENIIEIIDRETEEPIRTFINIPGLFIQGCSFKNLHPDNDLSVESKYMMRQYGAVIDE
jgi:WD40 repeat protein